MSRRKPRNIYRLPQTKHVVGPLQQTKILQVSVTDTRELQWVIEGVLSELNAAAQFNIIDVTGFASTDNIYGIPAVIQPTGGDPSATTFNQQPGRVVITTHYGVDIDTTIHAGFIWPGAVEVANFLVGELQNGQLYRIDQA